ncbi:MAG: glycosyltransferase [Candidatus Andersenbacteria bacterium]
MLTQKPLVSVLLSVHQDAHSELVKTLDSVVRQTYPRWELITVDDGSIDATHDILTDFQERYSIQVLLLKNSTTLGLTKSLVCAANMAKGIYLARLDSGDEFEADKLSQQVAFLEAHPNYGIVGCNYINTLFPEGASRKYRLPETDSAIRKTIVKKNPFAHSCVLLRTSAYEKVGGYDPAIRYGQDYDLWFRMLTLAKAANLPDFLCRRTIHKGSISYQKQRAQMFQCVKTQWKYMDKTNPLHYAYLLEPLLLAAMPQQATRGLRSLLR